MTLQVELPADITQALEKRWGDVSRHLLESLAIEGYRSGDLTRSQVRRMLGFETGLQVDEFMKQAGVPFPYTPEDFEADLARQRELGILPAE